jgi:hypothetical protein
MLWLIRPCQSVILARKPCAKSKRITGSKPVRGETLLKPRKFKRELQEARKRLKGKRR